MTVGAGALVACSNDSSDQTAKTSLSKSVEMPNHQIERLSFPWQTTDPFLFCVYHLDDYPPGNGELGPSSSLAGRNIGSDFSGMEGWSMYHGQKVPGFPRHPHRGFETVTVTKTGLVDHSDSLGATARYGQGDTQWMTAGSGIVHAEMFPLRDTASRNFSEFFQIWINLPSKDKFADPHFTMMWNKQIPVHRFHDSENRKTVVKTICGALNEQAPPSPPPSSWASKPGSHVGIWTIDLEPKAKWTLPAVDAGVNRALYFYTGDSISVDGQSLQKGYRILLNSQDEVEIVGGQQACSLLLLQGKPIGEPVAQHGPFVMNSMQEVQQAFFDYRSTGFGGWPWDRDDPVHAAEDERFAIHADGRRDVPT